MAPAGVLVVILLVVIAVLAAVLVAARPRLRRRIFGGSAAAAAAARARAAKGDVVVDTLNLTHHLMKPGERISQCAIVDAIRHSTPILREHFPGMIVYVIKDRDSERNDARAYAIYQDLARDQRVHIHIVERPASGDHRASWQPSGSDHRTHQALGRDDLYVGLLAWRLRCGALTADRMSDFGRLKTEVAPFVVRAVTPWGTRYETNYVNPGAREYARVRAPTRLDYADYDL